MKKHKSMLNVSWGGIRNEKWRGLKINILYKTKIATERETERETEKVHGYFSVLWIINLLNAFYMNINVFIKWYCCSIYLDLCWMFFPLVFLYISRFPRVCCNLHVSTFTCNIIRTFIFIIMLAVNIMILQIDTIA